MRIQAYARFLRALLVTNVQALLAQRANLIFQAALMLLNNLGFFAIWWALFNNVPKIRGWVLADMQLLYGFSTAAYGVTVLLAGGVRQISRWVDQGELDPLLVQPKPTWLYAVGSRAQASGLGDVLSGIFFLAISGRISLTTTPLAAACVLCGACVFLGSALAFYSLAFWVPRTEILSRQLLDFLIMFSLYPESLFSGALRALLFSAMPAAFISYLPVQVIRDAAPGALLWLLLGAAASLALGITIFQRGIKRYASGSRFGIWG